jgi:hypothetical protein
MEDAMQQFFNPVDFEFKWTPDWYEWDSEKAIKAALTARDARAKALRSEGRQVRCFTLAGQQITRGGIGTPHPEVDFVVPVYGLNAN